MHATSSSADLSTPHAHHTQGHLLKDQLELVKVRSSTGATRYTIKPLDAELTFDKGLFVFVRAVQLLTSHNKDTIVVSDVGIPGQHSLALSPHVPPSLPCRRRRRPLTPARLPARRAPSLPHPHRLAWRAPPAPARLPSPRSFRT